MLLITEKENEGENDVTLNLFIWYVQLNDDRNKDRGELSLVLLKDAHKCGAGTLALGFGLEPYLFMTARHLESGLSPR